VFDASGQALGPNTPGELAIAGVQLASGYLNESELTARRFPSYARQRWYLTGDQAIQDAAGVFHCLGRIDNQIKVMGYRVELEEVDAQLREVSHADVVGSIAWPVVEGMARGIVSFVHASAIDAERLLNDLKARVPAYMLPTRIVALDNMPLNASGKVDRRALARLLESTQV
jgi:acyl-coenzyme A synthetase/AMP-(fatty) acid ligase